MNATADDPQDQGARSANAPTTEKTNIDTGGGTYVEGDVHAGTFVGRDNITNVGYTAEEVEKIVAASRDRPAEETLSPDLAPILERKPFEPETVLVPAGPFWMGSDDADASPHEQPGHEVTLPVYRIGLYPVTNAQYEVFVRQSGRLVNAEMGWVGQRPPPGTERLPVVGVTFFDAVAYCSWLCEQTGRHYTLPHEAHWEKAARGSDGRRFPWGNEWAEGRCNQGGETITAVDAFPPQSPFGCYDLVGNLREWTRTLWGESFRQPDPRYAYPWQDDGRNDASAGEHLRRVYRGSAASDSHAECRCSARGSYAADKSGPPRKRHGFRVVMEIGE